jgi:hypothetical protein
LYVPSGFYYILKLSTLIPKYPKTEFPNFLRFPTTSSFIFSNFSFYNFSSSGIIFYFNYGLKKLGSISNILLASAKAWSYSSSSLRIFILWYNGFAYIGLISIDFENSPFAYNFLPILLNEIPKLLWKIALWTFSSGGHNLIACPYSLIDSRISSDATNDPF